MFDEMSFSSSAINLFVVDMNENEDCLGKFGLPDTKTPVLINYIHNQIKPSYIGDPSDPTSIQNINHLAALREFCRIESDHKMLWNRCSYYLVDYTHDPALVLITETKEIDPAENWLGNLVISAYEIAKGTHSYLVPVIGPI